MTISEKVSKSLKGKYGEQARRWKGNNAGYVAIHMWIKKHWGTPDHCDMCHKEGASRYEWCNKDKQYSRVREDWLQLCPSCHRLFDQKDKCRRGHPYTLETTHINTRGHRRCLICKAMREG